MWQHGDSDAANKPLRPHVYWQFILRIKITKSAGFKRDNIYYKLHFRKGVHLNGGARYEIQSKPYLQNSRHGIFWKSRKALRQSCFERNMLSSVG